MSTAIPELHVPLDPHGHNFVFTDGSCLWQNRPDLRVAAWGAVLASPLTADWDYSIKGILGSNVLPGLYQTAFRAELYAVAHVAHHAAVVGATVTVYSDCLGVINRCNLLLASQIMQKVNVPNSDLWLWLSESLEILGPQKFRIVKTKAHCPVPTATTKMEAWLYWNNAVVDQIAKTTNQQRPAEFWVLWREHAMNLEYADKLHSELAEFMMAVAKLSVQTSNQTSLDACAAVQPRTKRTFDMTYDCSRSRQILLVNMVLA